MKENTRAQIVFTKIRTAELLETPIPPMDENSVKVRMEYTVVSGGSERAFLIGAPNTDRLTFPIQFGYCGVGRVLETGKAVTKVKEGDRVLVYHGHHSTINVVDQSNIYKVENDEIDSVDASLVIIAAMGLGGVRKLRIEIGEPAMVIGLGLLGIFAMQFERLNGAYPVIVSDMNPKRRELALKLGADYALNPADPDFKEQIMKITKGKGVRATVEVTGASVALNQALDCASFMGRISLLGCTRKSDTQVDYYTQVHSPGVELIGAHNLVRPKTESYPYHWTNADDCAAILDLIAAGRIQSRPIVSRICKPEDCAEIYLDLCDNPEFPMGTLFDWRSDDYGELKFVDIKPQYLQERKQGGKNESGR